MDIIDIKLKEAEMSQFLDVHSKPQSRTERVSFNRETTVPWIIEHRELDWKRARRHILNVWNVGTAFD